MICMVQGLRCILNVAALRTLTVDLDVDRQHLCVLIQTSSADLSIAETVAALISHVPLEPSSRVRSTFLGGMYFDFEALNSQRSPSLSKLEQILTNIILQYWEAI